MSQPALGVSAVTQSVHFRYRITFAKRSTMRWTGHLDLRQSWERMFRRAHLPLVYSSGFHPHPKLVFASPLPLGFTSEAELVDASLAAPCRPALLAAELQRCRAPGLELIDVRQLTPGEPSVAKLVDAADYEVAVEPTHHAALQQRIPQLLAASELPRVRRGKAYDLRPRLQLLELDTTSSCLRLQLACRPSQTGRPEEVLDELGLDPHGLIIQRKALILTTPSASAESGV